MLKSTLYIFKDLPALLGPILALLRWQPTGQRARTSGSEDGGSGFVTGGWYVTYNAVSIRRFCTSAVLRNQSGLVTLG